MIPDPDRVAALIRQVADEAIRPRFRRLAKHEIREKSPGNLVTVADTEAERLLAPQLRALAPGSLVVGEEAAATDPDILDHLRAETAVWLVDPVDGTINFASGHPDYAVIVAFAERGAVRAGWILAPEHDKAVCAVAGDGAWTDGRRLALSAPPKLAEMVGAPSGRLPGGGRMRAILARHPGLGPLVAMRCSGRTYMELAEGRYHYAVFGRTLPWDHAAGWLIHREAGGFGAFLDGAPYSVLRHDHPLLLAPDRESWEVLRAILIPS
jgi:fructose-1,6-bisphosphatase/inositol monophosphatase family enzyme